VALLTICPKLDDRSPAAIDWPSVTLVRDLLTDTRTVNSKMKKSTLLFALVAASVPASASDLPKDLDKLQGTWVVISKASGKKNDYVPLDGYRIVINGDRLTWKLKSHEDDTVKFRTDPTQKPKQLDLDIRDGKVRNRCIYELDGERLRLSIGHFYESRPRDFSGSKTTTLLLLKREGRSAQAK
jgi:uncharacterized protein (TIGR03067 family)